VALEYEAGPENVPEFGIGDVVMVEHDDDKTMIGSIGTVVGESAATGKHVKNVLVEFMPGVDSTRRWYKESELSRWFEST